MRKILLSIALIIIIWNSPVFAIPIGGIEFPDGEASFADAVYSYSPGSNVGPGHNDPNDALGLPGGGSVALGIGGELILQFIDNSLTTSGDASADLHIFEVGPVVEWMNVAISTDALGWINLGNVLGQPTSIDIDAFAGVTLGALYNYVRISDIPPSQTGYPWGEADITAVGAISTVVHVPEPATLALVGIGLFSIGFARFKRN